MLAALDFSPVTKSISSFQKVTVRGNLERKMSFLVVQTRKNKRSRPTMTVVPSGWVKNKSIYWPKSNLVTLSTDGQSEPDMASWSQQKCKVVGSGASYAAAETIMKRLEVVTDSEDALEISRGTRGTPGVKKAKFHSKIYQLAPTKTQLEVSTKMAVFFVHIPD